MIPEEADRVLRQRCQLAAQQQVQAGFRARHQQQMMAAQGRMQQMNGMQNGMGIADRLGSSDSGSESAGDEGSTLEEKELLKLAAAERTREGADMLQATLLAAERNTSAMEIASLEAQQAKIAAMEVAKRIDKQDPGEF